MKEKGFTLVEMIGVLLVLAVILSVSVPSIINMLDKQAEKKYEDYKKTLFLASETYVERNRDITDGIFNFLDNTGDTACITLNTLIANGYIKSSLVDPKENKKVTEIDYFIKVTVETDKTLNYEYKSTCTEVGR